MKKVTTSTLLEMKQQGQKITALTAYDASFAKMFDEQGVDVLLIGDSLGMVLQGCDDTLSVSVDDIAYHTRAVRKGTQRAFVIADMPFMSYATPEQTYANAATLMAAGASMVKVEGGDMKGMSAEQRRTMLNELRKKEGASPKRGRRRRTNRKPAAS